MVELRGGPHAVGVGEGPEVVEEDEREVRGDVPNDLSCALLRDIASIGGAFELEGRAEDSCDGDGESIRADFELEGWAYGKGNGADCGDGDGEGNGDTDKELRGEVP